MNPLDALTSRSRVEELARLLEGAVAGPGAVTTGHAGLALRLRSLAPAEDGPLALRPEFRAALRTRLLAVAAVAPAAVSVPATRAASWPQGARVQRRLGATAGAMAGVIAVAGIGIASSRSLPGQPFYGLKRASEGVELSFTSGQVAQGGKHLELAGTRLREVAALAHGDGELALAPLGSAHLQATGAQAFGSSLTQHVRSTLADMDGQTRTGRRLLEAAYRSTGRTVPLRMLVTFAAEQSHLLTALLPDLPPGAGSSAQRSLALLASVATNANGLLSLGSCTGACDPAAAGPQLPTGAPSGGPAGNGVPGCGCPPPSTGPGAVPHVGPGGSPPVGGRTPSGAASVPPARRGATPTATTAPARTSAPPAPGPGPGNPLPPFVIPTAPVPLPAPLPTVPAPGRPLPTGSLPALPLAPVPPLLSPLGGVLSPLPPLP